MRIKQHFQSAWHKILGDSEQYKLDQQWKELLNELRHEIKKDGFDLEENEDLYLSIVAHVVRENQEGFEMLAEEEMAEKARLGEDTSLDESASVKIKTIDPDSP